MYTTGLHVAHSARKHGIKDEDMQHAVRNFVTELYRHGPGGSVLHYVVGPSMSGTMLELVIVDPMDPNEATIIHAMKARSHFMRRAERR